jgi:hypothetical protein
MTGIRSWMGAISTLGPVVISVQERTTSPVSGAVHSSHSPARARGLRSLRWKKKGVFGLVVCFHSYQPSTSTRQRRRLKAERKLGFSDTVSQRALMSLLPIAASLAHEGMSPQR